MTAADKRQAEEKLNSLDRENLKAYILKGNGLGAA